jgi:sarcosine oxidase
MSRTWDVIVLGAGGVGSAAMFHLARRGLRVLGLEQHDLGHGYGSSHGQSRIIRKAYFEHADYVPLLKRSYELWDELQTLEHRQDLFIRCGLLQVGAPDGEVIPGVLESAWLHGLDVERVDSRDLKRRFPCYNVGREHTALYERDAGYLRVEECVLAHARQATALGAEMCSGVAVHEWDAGADGVQIVTSDGTYSAGALVVTAGAWAPRLLRTLGVTMRVLRKQLFWLAAKSAAHRVDKGCPCFFYELPTGQFYGFPELDAFDGVKLACHSGGDLVTDPSQVDRTVAPSELAKVKAFAADWLPEIRGDLLRHDTCLYTMSPDEHFIVDVMPDQPNVCFAAGLSGHGFKFASVLGEILADIATEGSTRLPAQFLGLRRFHSPSA